MDRSKGSVIWSIITPAQANGDPMAADLLLKQSLYMIGLFIFISLIIARELGYQFGRRLSKGGSSSGEREKGPATITTAVLGLVAFMLAISLSMANGRFDARRGLMLEEANAIGTAYLRAQTIGGPHGEEIMRLIADYAQLRLDFFAAGEDQDSLRTNRQGAKEDVGERICHSSRCSNPDQRDIAAIVESGHRPCNSPPLGV